MNELIHSQLLNPNNLELSQLESLIGSISTNQIDYADIYFQSSRLEAWTLDDGIVKDAIYSIEQGAGIRAISGEKIGFAYTDELQLNKLQDAGRTARAICSGGKSQSISLKTNLTPHHLYSEMNPLNISSEDKVSLLNDIEAYLHKQDSRVIQVTSTLVACRDLVLVLGSDGTLQYDVRPLVRMNIHVILEHQGRREQGTSGVGGRYDLAVLVDNNNAFALADEALRQALINLESIDAPAGIMPVVLGPGWPGVLLHEAVGHGLEGDFNRKGSSAFSGRIGEQVASPLCTVVDDGTLDQRRGSLNVDDEGTITGRTVLIKNGILKNYLHDKHNARLMGMTSTGNGRRQSYAHLPIPRMTNTFMLAGEHDPQSIIASVTKGLYATNFAGGQVDITSGKFVFSTNEAYLIENGKITAPVKGATLIGNGPEVMNMISMLGNDLQLDAGIGVCGKDGQSVPVGVGQPTLKIDELTVGGTTA